MNRYVSARVVALALALAVGGGFSLAASDRILSPAPAGTFTLEAVRDLIRSGKYAEAEKAARALLAAAEKTGGCESLEAAEAMDLLVDALTRGGKAGSVETLALAEEAVATKEKALGLDDVRVGNSLLLEASVLRRRGRHAEARGLLERGLAITTAELGPDARRAVPFHNNLATELQESDPAAAERHGREGLRIVEAVDGPESEAAADIRANLANIAADRGEMARAEGEYGRALLIYEKGLGPRHPKVATLYHNLGYLHFEMGDHERARAELEKALEIREQTIGRAHPQTVMTLGNLVIVESSLGLPVDARWEELVALADQVFGREHEMPAGVRANYATAISERDPVRARKLVEEAFAVFSRTLGPTHPRSLSTLSTLGKVTLRSGDLPAAERYLEQAVHDVDKNPGTPPFIVRGALQGLASCKAEEGRLVEARVLHERAVSHAEKAYGSESPYLAAALAEFGTFLQSAGDLPAAETVEARALAIRERALGPQHPRVGETLVAVADLKAQRGDVEEAMPLFERGIAIAEETHASDDPRLANGYRAYASCLLKRGDARRALDAALRAESISTQHLRKTVAALPERQALAVVAKNPSALDLAVSAAVELRDLEASARVLDAVVRSRALVLDEMARRHRSLREAHDPGLEPLFAEYAAARSRLANLAVQGEDERSPERSRRRLREAQEAKDAAERTLAERSAAFREGKAVAAAGLAEVRGSLPADAALVSFVRYTRHPGSVRPGRKAKPALAVDSYAAFVLRRSGAAPALIALGPTKGIDAQVALVRKAVAEGGTAPAGSVRFAEVVYRRAAAALRDQVWKPLVRSLGSSRQVFLVPDGSLQLVNFAALPDGGRSYLVETGPLLRYLSAERDLARAGGTTGRGLLAAGAPDFDDQPPARTERNAALEPSPSVGVTTAVYRGALPSCASFGAMHFEALPSAAREIEEVAEAWEASRLRLRGLPPANGRTGIEPVVLAGASAGETAVKRGAPGRRILHLATHGFFLGDCSSPAGGRNVSTATGRSVFVDNPLLLSGLALAGANRRASARPDTDDGILTAEEIAALDLTGVGWAVLSACETGLGELRAGEGLFGLRRAFQVAGARTLITSLWAIEDEASRGFMKALYEKHLVDGLPTAEAVRAASLEVLRQRRAAGRGTHPFFWAGFVAAGE